MAWERIELRPWAGETTWVEWDCVAGELRGAGAEALGDFIADATRRRIVEFVTQNAPVSDPLHRREEMTLVILGAGYELPAAFDAPALETILVPAGALASPWPRGLGAPGPMRLADISAT